MILLVEVISFWGFFVGNPFVETISGIFVRKSSLENYVGDFVGFLGNISLGFCGNILGSFLWEFFCGINSLEMVMVLLQKGG